MMFDFLKPKKTTVIFVNGHRLEIEGDSVTFEGENRNVRVSVQLEGDALNVKSDGSVSCHNVTGSVSANGSVKCASVGRDVKANGSVDCESVGGNATAGGSIRARGHLGGKITAGGSVKIG
jgi:hypothetical protein